MSDLDDIIDQLKQKRDELQVQMHLASKDTQDEWKELEGKMKKLIADAKLDETGEGVGDKMGELGLELKKGYERIMDAVRNS